MEATTLPPPIADPKIDRLVAIHRRLYRRWTAALAAEEGVNARHGAGSKDHARWAARETELWARRRAVMRKIETRLRRQGLVVRDERPVVVAAGEEAIVVTGNLRTGKWELNIAPLGRPALDCYTLEPIARKAVKA